MLLKNGLRFPVPLYHKGKRTMRRLTAKRAELYLTEYPRALAELHCLARLAAEQDPNVTAIILFGSVARGTPHDGSDIDVLLLLRDVPRFFACDHATLLIQTGNCIAPNAIPQWGLAPILGASDLHDLDADFIACIAVDGVLLYKNVDVTLPPVLDHLHSFAVWERNIAGLLARCGRLTRSRRVMQSPA